MPAAIVVGGVIGAGAVISTILLMFMKTSLHNHIYPDYTFSLMAGIAERLPAWIIAGGLIGLAMALAYAQRTNSSGG